jgi:hypothetical protein
MMIPKSQDSWGGSWQETLPYKQRSTGFPYMSPPLYQTGPVVVPIGSPVPPGGTPIDPTTGMPVATDPTTGQAIDPSTGLPLGSSTPAAGGLDLSSLTSASIFGIPILYIGIGIAAWYFLKKR